MRLKYLTSHDKLRVAEPETIYSLRVAYLKDRDRFEAVGIPDLNHDDLTDVFRGLFRTLGILNLLILYSLFMIGVNAIILAGLPSVKGQVVNTARLIVESGSNGIKHVLAYARAAKVTKVIYAGSFANVLHPDDSWNPIVVTENGKRQNQWPALVPTSIPRLELSDSR